jgi:hypothetical protein
MTVKLQERQMKSDALIVDQTYFLLGYHDRAFRFPFVKTFIYLGRDICGKGSEPCWCFQDATSFVHMGSAVHRTNGMEDALLLATEDCLSNFVSWSGLVGELSENQAMQDSGKSLSEKSIG